MNLAGNTAAIATLKADILADPVLAAQPLTPDGAFAIAAAYNLTAAPSFTVWKSLVPRGTVGSAINMQELNARTTGDTTSIQTMFQVNESGFNASLADRRAAFDAIFTQATSPFTKAALAILWRRLATRAEKLFADKTNGNGADATPATLVQEGTLSLNDVLTARAS